MPDGNYVVTWTRSSTPLGYELICLGSSVRMRMIDQYGNWLTKQLVVHRFLPMDIKEFWLAEPKVTYDELNNQLWIFWTNIHMFYRTYIPSYWVKRYDLSTQKFVPKIITNINQFQGLQSVKYVYQLAQEVENRWAVARFEVKNENDPNLVTHGHAIVYNNWNFTKLYVTFVNENGKHYFDRDFIVDTGRTSFWGQFGGSFDLITGTNAAVLDYESNNYVNTVYVFVSWIRMKWGGKESQETDITIHYKVYQFDNDNKNSYNNVTELQTGVLWETTNMRPLIFYSMIATTVDQAKQQFVSVWEVNDPVFIQWFKYEKASQNKDKNEGFTLHKIDSPN